MKKLFIAFALLPVLAVAQTKTYSVNDGSFYVKEKTNLRGNLQLETGFSAPLLKSGNLSFAANGAYVQSLDNLWKNNGWTVGLTAGYNLKRGWAAYTKAKTDLAGNWQQETGLRLNLFHTSTYAVAANAGYIVDYPVKTDASPKWTMGVTVSFPLWTLFK